MPTINIGLDDAPEVASPALVYDGPTLYVEIGFDANFRPVEGRRPDLPPSQFPALVDTGALDNCIDSALAERLNLPIVARQMIAGVHGAEEVNFHLAQIYVPSLDVTAHGHFAGVHLVEGGQSHFALLGRTFLRGFRMVYDGRTGDVTLSDE